MTARGQQERKDRPGQDSLTPRSHLFPPAPSRSCSAATNGSATKERARKSRHPQVCWKPPRPTMLPLLITLVARRVAGCRSLCWLRPVPCWWYRSSRGCRKPAIQTDGDGARRASACCSNNQCRHLHREHGRNARNASSGVDEDAMQRADYSPRRRQVRQGDECAKTTQLPTFSLAAGRNRPPSDVRRGRSGSACSSHVRPFARERPVRHWREDNMQTKCARTCACEVSGRDTPSVEGCLRFA